MVRSPHLMAIAALVRPMHPSLRFDSDGVVVMTKTAEEAILSPRVSQTQSKNAN
jgi:hypothetical protein